MATHIVMRKPVWIQLLFWFPVVKKRGASITCFSFHIGSLLASLLAYFRLYIGKHADCMAPMNNAAIRELNPLNFTRFCPELLLHHRAWLLLMQRGFWMQGKRLLQTLWFWPIVYGIKNENIHIKNKQRPLAPGQGWLAAAFIVRCSNWVTRVNCLFAFL